jgi:calpain family cysteine protease
MQSPTEALWPCVIEKAYAAKLKSYEELDSEEHTANEFWKVLVGSDPEVVEVKDDTDVSKIHKIADAAPKIPTIGASRDDAHEVEPWHGYAVPGVKGDNIKLYNPWADKVTISIKTFRKNFKAILRGKH